jgi:O-antigen/teichoic acid export membrane protein
MGAEVLGVFTSASSIGLLLLTIIDWGYETRLPLFISSHPDLARQYIAEAHYAKIRLWGLALVFLLCGSAIQLLSRIGTTSFSAHISQSVPLVLYAFWALARGVTSTYSSALRGLQQFGVIARVENSFTLVSHIAAVGVLLLYSWQFFAGEKIFILCLVVGCLIAGEILKSAVFMRYLAIESVKIRYYSKGWRDIPFSRVHLTFVAMQALSILQSRAGIYALMLFASQTEVGSFSAVARLTIAMRIIPGTLFYVLLPRFVRSPEPSMLGKALLIGLVLGVVGSTGLYLLAENIIQIVYGTHFLHLLPLLHIMAWIFALQTLVYILEPYLLAQKTESFLNASMITSLTAFALVCAVIPADTGYKAAYLAVGLEALLVVVYGLKCFSLVRKKNPL